MFWVSFIFAALTSVIGFLFVPVFEIPPGKKSVPLDYLGAAVFTAGIAMFVYGLNDSENAGWKSPQIIITVILGTILVVAFPIIQYKEAHPVAPKYFLFNPRICLALGCFIVFGGGYTTWFYLATQMFINSFKYTPVNSALYLLVSNLSSPGRMPLY